MRRGVVVETGRDTYFLDLPAYDRWRRTIHLRIAFLLLVVALLMLGGTLLTVLARG